MERFISFFGSILAEPIAHYILKHFGVPIKVLVVALILIGVWSLIALFLLIKNSVVAFRDKKQYPYMFSLPMKYDDRSVSIEEISDKGYKDFKWYICFNFPRGRSLEEFRSGKRSEREINIKDVRGPYCGFRKKCKEHSATLENNMRKIIESEKRKNG